MVSVRTNEGRGHFVVQQIPDLGADELQEKIDRLREKYPPYQVARPKNAKDDGLTNEERMMQVPRNQELLRYFDAYRGYFEARRRRAQVAGRTLRLDLGLQEVSENVHAEDIAIHLWFPSEMTVYEKGDLPERPEVPRRPRFLDDPLRSSLRHLQSAVNAHRFADNFVDMVRPDLDPLGLVTIRESGHVTVEVKGVKAGEIVELDPLYVELPETWEARGFQVKIDLVHRGKDPKQRGMLNISVSERVADAKLVEDSEFAFVCEGEAA